ncbi:MAG: hypothetical protein CK530_01410 [Planctomycetaceae bacterium]|nr:MAG: hypothetical protein CK530_13210 [Planctomycetaceae bacterium]PHY03368.1 MAG: hypothetical protein CK530_01410 [Planctomycetaceae bacterium]
MKQLLDIACGPLQGCDELRQKSYHASESGVNTKKWKSVRSWCAITAAACMAFGFGLKHRGGSIGVQVQCML